MDEEQQNSNSNRTLIVQTGTDQFITQTIKSPVSNAGGHQVASIRSVTPNTKSGAQAKTPSPAGKVVNNIVLTPKNQAQFRASKSITIQSSGGKGQPVNISPSQAIPISNNQLLNKVIMTTSGQQLFITSPVKPNAAAGASKAAPSSPNVSIRPKPANITIQSPVGAQTSTGGGDKQPHYQIVRLISTSNSGPASTTNSTIKQITIPASALKGLNASQLLGQSGTAVQFMYAAPTQIQQQSAATPKQVTFSTAAIQPAAAPATSTSFKPILPNPSGLVSANASATSKTLAKAHHLHHQNGPKGDELAAAVQSSHQPSTAAAGTVATLPSTSAVASAPSNRPRKPCNCTRSQCLKLYCDCFANGEFCSNCNCINCSNNLDHEENRQKAIKQCLERNPHAFHPKIGKGKTTAQEGIERRHTKGCNCRRSGCLKNYCECYEAKILCTDLCKCCACKNYEDSYERKSLMHLVDAVDIRSSLHGPSGVNFQGKENDPLWSNEFRPKLPVPFLTDRLISCSFITNDLVDATAQCLIAQAEKSQKLGLNGEETERAIIEEFGSLLSQIIDTNKQRREK